MEQFFFFGIDYQEYIENTIKPINYSIFVIFGAVFISNSL